VQVGHLALSLNSAGNLLIYLLAGYLNTEYKLKTVPRILSINLTLFRAY
jgi:hypothetical protein